MHLGLGFSDGFVSQIKAGFLKRFTPFRLGLMRPWLTLPILKNWMSEVIQRAIRREGVPQRLHEYVANCPAAMNYRRRRENSRQNRGRKSGFLDRVSRRTLAARNAAKGMPRRSRHAYLITPNQGDRPSFAAPTLPACRSAGAWLAATSPTFERRSPLPHRESLPKNPRAA